MNVKWIKNIGQPVNPGWYWEYGADNTIGCYFYDTECVFDQKHVKAFCKAEVPEPPVEVLPRLEMANIIHALYYYSGNDLQAKHWAKIIEAIKDGYAINIDILEHSQLTQKYKVAECGS